jgi:hypothetical protein
VLLLCKKKLAMIISTKNVFLVNNYKTVINYVTT